MWLLHFIPDQLIVDAINMIILGGLIATIAAIFMDFIPWIRAYRLPTLLLGVLALTVGSYLKGWDSSSATMRLRVAELQKQVDAAEQKSQTAVKNQQVKIVERVKVIHDATQSTNNAIRRRATDIDRECNLTDAAVDIYNQAVVIQPAEETAK